MMQNKLIKLTGIAISSFISSLTFAQSNVTVYGIVDMGYVKSSGQTTRYSALDDGRWSGSRLGFKGEEMIGDGLKAIFTLEFGTKADVGDGFTQTRQSFVGLESDQWGTLTLGRQYAPSYTYMRRNSSNGLTGNYTQNDLISKVISQANGTMSVAANSRWNNSIAFQSKNYSGFSSRIIYSFGERTPPEGSSQDASAHGASQDGAKFGISADYKNGPFNIDLIYESKLKGVSPDPSDPKDLLDLPWVGHTEEWYLGAAYDFKVIKLFASYQQSQSLGLSKNRPVRTVARYRDNGSIRDYRVTQKINDPLAKIWSVGASIPVSKVGTVRMEYAGSSLNGDDPAGDSSVYGPMYIKEPNARAWGLSLGYTHELSKRTRLYSSVAYMKNNEFQNSGSAISATGEAGQAIRSFQMGIRHTF